MPEDLIQIGWFLLPAAGANMAACLTRRWPILNIPVDFKQRLKGRRILGNHKTVRGFVMGIAAAILIAFIQKIINFFPEPNFLVNYGQVNFILLGFLLGFGAMLGDSVKSFIKRRLKIKPGRPWLPFDQIDWIIGSMATASFYIKINFYYFVLSLLLFTPLHFLTNWLAYGLKIKTTKV